MLNELVVILLVSILLMYFILSSQFENFSATADRTGRNTHRYCLCITRPLVYGQHVESDECYRHCGFGWYSYQ